MTNNKTNHTAKSAPDVPRGKSHLDVGGVHAHVLSGNHDVAGERQRHSSAGHWSKQRRRRNEKRWKATRRLLTITIFLICSQQWQRRRVSGRRPCSQPQPPHTCERKQPLGQNAIHNVLTNTVDGGNGGLAEAVDLGHDGGEEPLVGDREGVPRFAAVALGRPQVSAAAEATAGALENEHATHLPREEEQTGVKPRQKVGAGLNQCDGLGAGNQRTTERNAEHWGIQSQDTRVAKTHLCPPPPRRSRLGGLGSFQS